MWVNTDFLPSPKEIAFVSISKKSEIRSDSLSLLSLLSTAAGTKHASVCPCEYLKIMFLSVLLKWNYFSKTLQEEVGAKEIVGGSVKCSFSAYCSPGLGAWEGSSPGTTVIVEGCIFLQTSLSAHHIWNVLTNPTWEIEPDFSHLKGVVLDNRNS